MGKSLTSKVLLLFCLVFTTQLHSQDCGDPIQLCAETSNSDVLDNLQPFSFDCIDTEYTYFYYFGTNTNTTNTGNVNITINNIQCLNGGLSDTLYAVVLQSTNAVNPCDPAQFLAVSNCDSDTLQLNLETIDLNANSEYVVVVGTDHDPALGDCGFDISIEGPAVDIEASTNGFPQITLGQSIEMTVDGDDGVVVFWTPDDYLDDSLQPTVTAFPEETITYTVTGYVDGCEVTDLITVVVGSPISVPNTITANQDGINDLWKIGGISAFTQAQVTVFDRWGQVVFKTIGYNSPWDGTNKGKFLPTATYYYVIELNSLDIPIEPITGSITVVH